MYVPRGVKEKLPTEAFVGELVRIACYARPTNPPTCKLPCGLVVFAQQHDVCIVVLPAKTGHLIFRGVQAVSRELDAGLKEA
jgi:hypothetical protein